MKTIRCSTSETGKRIYRPVCDQCQVLVINGVVCHEIGCPDGWKGKWVECKECGTDFKMRRQGQRHCSRSCERV